MRHLVLLYGATGYTGRLITAEFARIRAAHGPGPWFDLILAGRDAQAVEELARAHDVDYRVFGLDDQADIVKQLADIDVTINVAGPFAWTAERLLKASLEADCHYVDINGEVDVYLRLDDFHHNAQQRNLIIVCGAGHSAAASDLLLEAALPELARKGLDPGDALGAIRIAMSRVVNFSRGSAQTVARSLREQVLVYDKGTRRHEPVGRLERTFDFSDRRTPSAKLLRIASAANLVDTLTAHRTVNRSGFKANRIESYVETNQAERIAYQAGALLAPMAALPWVRGLLQVQAGLLPEGPTSDLLEQEQHTVVLEIEDAKRHRVIDLSLLTPNVYQFTAQLVVAIAHNVAISEALRGWCTPAQLLERKVLVHDEDSGPLRGCSLTDRIG